MAQVTQTELAIGELLLAGTIHEEDFKAFILAYPIPRPDTSTLVLLEEQPRRIVEPGARQDLLYFASFDATFDFTSYTSGRIFHALGELHWERQHSTIRIVYTGREEYKPELQHAEEIALDSYFPLDREYFLFGKRLDDQQLNRIGLAGKKGDFAEVRIPRLLRYPQLPTLKGAERLQLVMREYIDNATALNFTYRFKNLVPYQKQSETTGVK